VTFAFLCQWPITTEFLKGVAVFSGQTLAGADRQYFLRIYEFLFSNGNYYELSVELDKLNSE
jgi:hypothetical protein